jgi:hypothetical protein
MAQPGDVRNALASGEPPAGWLGIEWGREINEQGGVMRWLASWLTGDRGHELDWFYSGWGDETTEHAVPAAATGVRLRKWVSEGLDPEYLDLPLDRSTVIRTAALDFDARQAHRAFSVPRHG